MKIEKFENKDCRIGMKNYPDKFFPLAIIDPQYGKFGISLRESYGNKVESARQRNGKLLYVNKTTFTPKKWDCEPPREDYFLELYRVSQHQIIWGVNYFRLPECYQSKGRIVWDKVNYSNDFSDCEISYCSFHDSVRLFRFMWNGMLQGKGMKDGHIMQGNKRLNEERIHPCQKPVWLYKWLLKNYAHEGDVILDTHVGSASSICACIEMGFSFVGYEIDEEYFGEASNRVEKLRRKLEREMMFDFRF